MTCPHCGGPIETQQRRAVQARWAKRLGMVALLMLVGCGPKLPPRPSLAERCQGNAVCMVIGAEVEADEAAAAQAYYPTQPTQRVFIHRWLVPGGRNSPAPIGYIDY